MRRMVQISARTVHLIIKRHVSPHAKSPAAILAYGRTLSMWGGRIANDAPMFGADQVAGLRRKIGIPFATPAASTNGAAASAANA
jgi:hypothetical protein